MIPEEAVTVTTNKEKHGIAPMYGEVDWQITSSLISIAAEWDRFLPENHALRSSNLLVPEQTTPAGMQFRYVIVRQSRPGGESSPVALLYFQLVQFNTSNYQTRYRKWWGFTAFEKLAIGKGFRILCCGNFLRIESPGLFFDENKLSKQEILSLFNRIVAEINFDPHALLIKDVELNWESTLTGSSYLRWPGDLTMKLFLQPSWKSFDDYASALRHKYAQRVRKARIKFQPIERKELTIDEIDQYADELYSLYSQVMLRQPIRLAIVRENYFKVMKQHLNDQFRVYGYFEHGKLIAFSSHILYPKMWELHFIGLNYSKNDTYWLYFNLMYDAIAFAFENKKTELELGRTARYAKAIIGATPVYYNSYYKLRGRVTKWIVKALNINFEDEMDKNWQNLHPFKQ